MIGDPYPDMHNRKQGRDKSKQNGREEEKKGAHSYDGGQAGTRPDLLVKIISCGICKTNRSASQSHE